MSKITSVTVSFEDEDSLSEAQVELLEKKVSEINKELSKDGRELVPMIVIGPPPKTETCPDCGRTVKS